MQVLDEYAAEDATAWVTRLAAVTITATTMTTVRMEMMIPATETPHDALPSLRPQAGSETVVLLATATNQSINQSINPDIKAYSSNWPAH